MLTINIPDSEYFDEKTNEFIVIKGGTVNLEHSLLSLSKWESKWHKPFLSSTQKSDAEILDYVRCMTLNEMDPRAYSNIPLSVCNEINEYINNPMTATWFSDNKNSPPNREVITSEIVYYWMVSLQIPFECETWHLNRLLTLIRVCNIKNSPSTKMSKKDIYSRNRALNAARRKQINSKG